MTHKISYYLILIFSFSFIGNASCVVKSNDNFHRLVFASNTSQKKFVFLKNDHIVFKEYSGRARNGKIIDFDGTFITIELGFGKLYNYFFGAKMVTIRYEELKSIANKEYGAYWYFTEWRGFLTMLFSIASFGVSLFYLIALLIAVGTETVRHPFQKYTILLES